MTDVLYAHLDLQNWVTLRCYYRAWKSEEICQNYSKLAGKNIVMQLIGQAANTCLLLLDTKPSPLNTLSQISLI